VNEVSFTCNDITEAEKKRMFFSQGDELTAHDMSDKAIEDHRRRLG